MNSLNVAHNFVKLSSELCIVQVLLGLKELSTLMEYTFWLYANVYLGLCKQRVCNTVESHFLGLSIRQSSTVGA